MSDDLARFIAERLDDEERAAERAENGNASPWHRRDGVVVGSTYRSEVDFDLWDVEGTTDGRLHMHEDTAAHIARHDPARVLAFVAAGRAIMELHTAVSYLQDWPVCVACVDWDDQPAYEPPPMEKAPCPTVRAFGAIWADHPDYRAEEWKP